MEVVVGKRELHNAVLVVDFDPEPLRELRICVPLVVSIPARPIRRTKEGNQRFSIRRRHVEEKLPFRARAKAGNRKPCEGVAAR